MVYAVQSGGSAVRKDSFWKELNGSTAKFKESKGFRVIVGDFNARLGSITGDHAKNSNKGEFMRFVQDHSLTNMNVIRTFGEYTFHNIRTGDRSIIDYLLTDLEPSRILEHKVLPASLGTSAQTAHKALLTKIRQSKQLCLLDGGLSQMNIMNGFGFR